MDVRKVAVMSKMFILADFILGGGEKSLCKHAFWGVCHTKYVWGLEAFGRDKKKKDIHVV